MEFNLGRVVGKDGTTPHIGDNGNWWIGDYDTGVVAQGNSWYGYNSEEVFNELPLKVGDYVVNTHTENLTVAGVVTMSGEVRQVTSIDNSELSDTKGSLRGMQGEKGDTGPQENLGNL
ncbi:MAG: hypothetical protein FWF56_06075 [Firmicutes bacterium]|nr:hypothetical protein [Bacillota bacterium]MCL1953952.1 hypothetical protein [Bacillota bacterium]